MASNKKKAKRVATLFGKQKVTTTPEIAAMIKSGEIDPSTHSIKGGKFAPKRKAVVGGVGIVPTANSANKGGMGSGAKSAAGNAPKTMSDKSGMGAGSNSAAGYTAGAAKSAGGYTAGNMDAVPGAGSMGAGSEGVPKSAVPSTDKATGQPITPSQKLQMDEQKALKIAPVKEEITAINTQLTSLMSALEEDDGEENMAAVRKKLEAFKAVFSNTDAAN